MHGIKGGGFTLIEAAVGIAVLLVGTLSVLTLVTSSIRANRQVPNRLTAVLLADEALLALQHIRDENLARGNPWDARLSLCNGQTCILGYEDADVTGDCTLTGDARSTAPKLLQSGNTVVYFDNDNDGFLQVNPADGTCAQTIFRREITVDYGNIGSGYIEPRVTVTWDDGGSHTYGAQSKLYEY